MSVPNLKYSGATATGFVYGVCPTLLNLPFKRLPKGTRRVRIRARNTSYAMAYVLQRDGLRAFVLKVNRARTRLLLGPELGFNRRIKQK